MTRIISALAAGTAMLFASAAGAAMADGDANNDGRLDNKEFFALESRGGSSDFDTWDTDGDGAISREEFSAGTFSRYDEDRSGDLSGLEYEMYDGDRRHVATEGQLPKPGDMKGEDANR